MSKDGETPIFSSFATEAIYAPLLVEFVAELPMLVAEIESAVEQGNADEARRLAHRLKGAAATYGFPELASVAGALECAVRGAKSVSGEPDLALLGDQARTLCRLARRVAAGTRPASQLRG